MKKDCVSLEVAKNLQKAGWKGESDFHWYKGIGGFWFFGNTTDMLNGAVEINHTTAPMFDFVSAPTATQLAEELRMYLFGKCLTIEAHSNDWRVGIPKEHFVSSSTLPDAIGLMTVYLLDNKLI